MPLGDWGQGTLASIRGGMPMVNTVLTIITFIGFCLEPFFCSSIPSRLLGVAKNILIINQLIPEDITKGYRIAGTGQIGSDGQVGQIGGAKLKVKAAINNKAEIFFVPRDINATDVNQMEAVEANNRLGNPLNIVPIAHVEEAIEYLKRLPKKELDQAYSYSLDEAI